MDTTALNTLHVTRVVGAAPDRVFEAWTRPEHMKRWACPGGTEVVLTHEGFPAEEAKAGHEEGWGSCLDKLEGMYAG